MRQPYKHAVRLVGTDLFIKEPRYVPLAALADYRMAPHYNRNALLSKNLFDVHLYTKVRCVFNAIEDGFSNAFPYFWKYGAGMNQREGRKCSHRLSQGILLNGMAKYEVVAITLTPNVVDSSDIISRRTFQDFQRMRGRYH